VSRNDLLLVTMQPEFSRPALAELHRLVKDLETKDLAPGLILCTTEDVPALTQRVATAHPIFVRHLAPVQTIVDLTNDEQDLGNMATALATLPSMALLERGTPFAVQSRLVHTENNPSFTRSYSSGMLNRTLAEAFAEETGAVEAIKKPQVIISILCTEQQGYLGISTAEDNLSSWPGGARHFAQTAEQISRAEFKLLEALEVFHITLPSSGRALDLGAAPGGWTRLLLAAGMHVTAVDPARLDPRLEKQAHLVHYRGYAQNYLEEIAPKQSKFDLIVNDMRMDAREAARTLSRAAGFLHKDGIVLSVLKLPHATAEIDPLRTLKEALSILNKSYSIVQAHQLFHNRQEVTVAAAQPLV